MDDDWKRDLRCVLEGRTECAANTPEACICKQLPPLVYKEVYNSKYGVNDENRTDG